MDIHQKGYIERQVQYLTQLLQEILFKKSKNKKEEAVQEIRDGLEEVTKDQPKEMHELDLEETLNCFTQDEKFKSSLAIAASDLLYEQSIMLEETSFSTSQISAAQAFLLYKKSLQNPDSAIPVTVNEKMNVLEDKLKHSDYLEQINQLVNN